MEIACGEPEEDDDIAAAKQERTGRFKAYASGRYSLLLFMLDQGLHVRACSLTKDDVASKTEMLREEFLKRVLNNLQPVLVRELLKNDLKSASDPRQIKKLGSAQIIKRDLEKLDTDLQSLKRIVRNEKRFNMEQLLECKQGCTMLAESMTLLVDEDLIKVSDIVGIILQDKSVPISQ